MAVAGAHAIRFTHAYENRLETYSDCRRIRIHLFLCDSPSRAYNKAAALAFHGQATRVFCEEPEILHLFFRLAQGRNAAG